MIRAGIIIWLTPGELCTTPGGVPRDSCRGHAASDAKLAILFVAGVVVTIGNCGEVPDLERDKLLVTLILFGCSSLLLPDKILAISLQFDELVRR